MNRFWRFIVYQKKAVTKYGIHSPFMYEFVTKVINDSKTHGDYDAPDKRIPSQYSRSSLIKLFKGYFLSRQKTGRLLFRMVRYFKPDKIIVFGDSSGIIIPYLIKGNPKARLSIINDFYSDPQPIHQAFDEHLFQNVEIHTGKPITILQSMLERNPSVNIAIVDRSLPKQTILECFTKLLPSINNESTLIFNNLHDSQETISAWKEIIRHPKVTASADLFRVGIVFFRKELSKQNFIIRF